MKEKFYTELIQAIEEQKPNKQQLSQLKHRLCKQYKIAQPPTDIDILLHTPVDKIPKLKPFLKSKPMRTGSGVVPIALMTKPLPCPHEH